MTEECYVCGKKISEEESYQNEGCCDFCAITWGADGEVFNE